LTLSFRPFVFL
jgi:hypothetical protein